jgi:hypothetical protein
LSVDTLEEFVSYEKLASTGKDPDSYYHARNLCTILPVLAQKNGLDSTSAEAHLKGIQSNVYQHVVSGGPEGFLFPALASGYAELLIGSKELYLQINSLISSISGITVMNDPVAAIESTGLKKLSTLNAICEVDPWFWVTVREFRILMLVRTVLDWRRPLTDTPSSWIVSTEILRLMRSLLAHINHLEGDFWEKTLNAMVDAVEVIRMLDDVEFSSALNTRRNISL